MPVRFYEVLRDELQEIDDRRRHVLSVPPPAMEGGGPVAMESAALARNLAGMGLSGGGIRSATFNLGIIQGLAEHGFLPLLDYLSTVSGGGYIGTWLHGVILRLHHGQPSEAAVRLSPDSYPVPGAAADDPVSFLRKYSNYLAPRLSLFSPDIWVILSIWLRNIFLNQCVLVPCLASVLLVPLFLGHVHQGIDSAWHDGLVWGSYAVAGMLLAFAVMLITVRLRKIVRNDFSPSRNRFLPAALGRISGGAGTSAALVALAALLLGSTRTNPTQWPLLGRLLGTAGLVSLFLMLQVSGGFVERFSARDGRRKRFLWLHLIWMPASCATFTGILLCGCLRWVTSWPVAGDWQENPGVPSALAWGPPLMILILCAGVSLLLGLMGADYPDSAREWVSRLGAVLGIYSVAWMMLFAIGIYAPLWIALLFTSHSKGALAGVGTWLITSGAGVLAGNSSKTQGFHDVPNRSVLELVEKVAPSVFLVGYLTLISVGLHYGIRWSTASAYFRSLPELGFAAWIGAANLGLFGLASLLAARVNINEFSMHHFYKNRLVRCYLGASRGRSRRADAFTGFDTADDFPLHKLRARHNYFGPYPIINTALNTNRGSELATQERKAGSFIYTPLYCGFTPESSWEDERQAAALVSLHSGGYRDTRYFGGLGGPSIGTPMAISGAAASPNMGFHTSGGLAFLLTVFNVRLGWWVGNPRWDGPAQRPGPLFALRYLLDELMARTSDRSKYLNLSDGGHYDNLGLYELVRRRCRFIFISDAEQDPGLSFGSLASAIRKCRSDFGVEIHIDVSAIQENRGLSRSHYAVGTIVYPEHEAVQDRSNLESDEKRAMGYLVYFKASLTGDEPEDVREYRARFSAFPHQSTADQFFTESQFESYRQLGLHIMRTTLSGIRRGSPLEEVCASLARNRRPELSSADTNGDGSGHNRFEPEAESGTVVLNEGSRRS